MTRSYTINGVSQHPDGSATAYLTADDNAEHTAVVRVDKVQADQLAIGVKIDLSIDIKA